MNRWVYYVSLAFIGLVVLVPLLSIALDPQGRITDMFKLGIDLEGGTSLIYELRPPEAGAEPPDARNAKRVIMGRIDPNGTRGYVVRAVGAHRLEIVLPGRPTRVSIEAEALALDALQARLKVRPPKEVPTADQLAPFAGGTQLGISLKPSLYMADIESRIRQAVIERIGKDAPPYLVVGLEEANEQFSKVIVLLAVPPGEKKALGEWEDLLTTALATQQDVSRVKRLVKQAGYLEFRIVADKVRDKDIANFDRILNLKKAGQPPDTPRYRWYPMRKAYERAKTGVLDRWNYIYVVDDATKTAEVLVDVGDGQNVTGKDLSRAAADRQEGEHVVSFRMRGDAAARFQTLTRPEMRERHLAVILDGVVQTAPSLEATLSTGGIIRGYDKLREVQEIATILNSGQLAASLGDPVTERTVGAELGADNIQKGVWASLIGFILVIVFMAVYYLFAGLVADLALTLNLVLTISIMHWIGQAWTLPGIAGLILSLGMAVDANVLINERFREEKGREGSLTFALKKAYERAFRVILDSNLTTLIPAIVLLLPGLATEEVKGFAIVMVIGLFISMFTAVVVTRMVFETCIKRGLITDLKMLKLFDAPHIDWMRIARVASVISVSLILVGAVVFYSRGSDKYDIEFTGGTQVELTLKMPDGWTDVQKIGTVRQRTGEVLGPSATVQELTYGGRQRAVPLDRFLVSISSAAVAPAIGKASDSERVKAALGEAFKDMEPETRRSSVTTKASKITEEAARRRLEAQRAAKPPEAPAPAPEKAPAPEAADTPAESSRYLPPEERQFLGKIAVEVDVEPPTSVQEISRRLDVFLRDRYPDLSGTLCRVDGKEAAGALGEFKSFDVWVRDDYAGTRGDQPSPAFWADTLRLALGSTETFSSTTSFEPTMAGETWHKAVIAIALSMALIVLYVWFRFAGVAFGLGAIVALVHDVFITLGAVALGAYIADTWFGRGLLITDMKINLPMVGAFLTLVGYSVNDTIVVYDRIREVRGKFGELSEKVTNLAINETLPRTVWTGFTTLLVLVVLYFFGGSASTLHGFSFVLLFGILVGTYSSVVVAAPVLVLRPYLMKVHAWAYPLVGVGLMVYYAFGWRTPQEFFGSWPGWVWAVLQLGWVGVTAWSQLCHVYGREWTLARTQPWLMKVLAGIGFLAPPGFVVLSLLVLLAPTGAAYVSWAGPAAFGAFVMLPVTYVLWRRGWGSAGAAA
jgi:SecD/SecF fusion protein